MLRAADHQKPQALPSQLRAAGGASSDWRNVSNGLPIWPPSTVHEASYQDPPQVQVLPDGPWFVVWTHGVGKAEGSPNIILSARSTSQGASWSAPVSVEPLAVGASSSASWANPLLVGDDKLYVFYTYNCWHDFAGGNPGVQVNTLSAKEEPNGLPDTENTTASPSGSVADKISVKVSPSFTLWDPGAIRTGGRLTSTTDRATVSESLPPWGSNTVKVTV